MKYYVIQKDCQDDTITFISTKQAWKLEDAGAIEYCPDCDSWHPENVTLFQVLHAIEAERNGFHDFWERVFNNG